MTVDRRLSAPTAASQRRALRRAALLALALLAVHALADVRAAPLRVGVAPLPPYAMQGADGAWSGLAVALWRRVADELDLAYDLVEIAPEAPLERLERGDLDLVLTAPATPEGARRVDYAPIYHATSLGVARPPSVSLLGILRGLFTPSFLWTALSLSVLLLIVGTVVWLLERRANGDQFSDDGVRAGIGSGFWWAGVTMTTIGYGDKAPITFWGRAVALVWMLVAMGVTASLTAAIVATVGAGQTRPLQLPADLRTMQVGAVAGHAGAAWLADAGIEARSYERVVAGVDALRSGEVDAFVAETAALRFAVLERGASELRVEPKPLLPRRYAFALPAGSARTPAVTVAALRVLSGDSWAREVERLLGAPGAAGAP